MTSAKRLGTEIAVSLMLRQLYVLASKQAEVGTDGLLAWRADLERQLEVTSEAAADADFAEVKRHATEAIDGVFVGITR